MNINLTYISRTGGTKDEEDVEKEGKPGEKVKRKSFAGLFAVVSLSY